jgi:hypothetical protein
MILGDGSGSGSGTTHIDALARCIRESEGKKLAGVSPEPGLRYICVRDGEGLGAEMPDPETISCIINDAKQDGSWPPYYPFTLSFRDPQHLYQFINGDFVILTLVDTKELERQYAALGFKIRVVQDNLYAIYMRHHAEESASAVSRQMFGRLLHEFLSLSEFVSETAAGGKQIAESLAKDADRAARGLPVSDGWTGVMSEELHNLFLELGPEMEVEDHSEGGRKTDSNDEKT